jgi:aryl-alcohol dehydrogenase-like predicted oxidoreductase
LGVIGYMALLQGVLTDLYPTLDDIAMWQRRTRHFDARKTAAARHGLCGEEATAQALAALRAVGRESGLPLSQLALQWAVANRDVACTLVGSRSASKLEANVHALEHPLSAEMVRRLNAITDPLKERLGRSFDYYEGPDNDRTR